MHSYRRRKAAVSAPVIQPLPESDLGKGRTRGLLAYVLLAYGLSWAWLIPLALTGALVDQGQGWPTHFPALLGPLLAAVLVSARLGSLRGLLASMRRVRVPVRWWLVALSPLAMLGVALLADVVTGAEVPPPAQFAQMSGLSSSLGVLGVGAVILLINGFGEETGWRGFALPTLQRRFSPLTAMLLVSVLWAGWHLPMFLVLNNFRSFGFGTTIGWLLGLAAGSIVLGWLYNRSGGSVVLVAVWHATFNIVGGTGAATGLVAAIVTTVVMLQAIVLVGAELRARRLGRPSVLGPHRIS